MNHKLTFLRAVSLTALAVGPLSAAALAQTAVTPGNILVYQVGANSSATTLSSAATATFINEYTPTGTLVQQIAVPTASTTSGTVTNYALTNSGSATSEGSLTISSNLQYASFAGYNAPVGTASVVGTASTANQRVVGNFNLLTGTIDTTTALTDAYSGNNIRGAVTTNGTSFYTSGAGSATDGGIRSATDGAATSTQVGGSTLINDRVVNIYNNNVYFSTGSGTSRGIYKVDTANQVSNLITPASGNSSPYDFFFTNATTLYVADSAAGLQKYTSADGGNTFSLSYTSNSSLLTGVTGFVGSSTANLFYAVTPSALYSVTDTGSTFSTPTQIVVAPKGGTNNTVVSTAFRGLVFDGTIANNASTPEPGVLPLVAEAGALVFGFGLIRRRRKA